MTYEPRKPLDDDRCAFWEEIPHPQRARYVQLCDFAEDGPDVVFRDVPGWTWYRANSCGEVETKLAIKYVGSSVALEPGCDWCAASGWVNKDGYHSVRLWRNGIDGVPEYVDSTVHRVVLLAFHGRPQAGFHGCHVDSRKSNNCIDNLRWDTPYGNKNDNRRYKLTDDQVRKFRRMVADGSWYSDLMDAFPELPSKRMVKAIATGKLYRRIKGHKVTPEEWDDRKWMPVNHRYSAFEPDERWNKCYNCSDVSQLGYEETTCEHCDAYINDAAVHWVGRTARERYRCAS